jgi:hypothetical protein
MLYLESSFAVMALPDLLQWVELAKKTGACRFVRGPATREIFFKDGRIVACSSDEPHLLLGQFLIANGRIDEITLQIYMKSQRITGRSLGQLLVRAGKIKEEQLQRLIEAKAEETVFGLFDWPDGMFRFDPDCPPPTDSMKIELDLQSVLMEGARRFDELNAIREAFPSLHVVLHKTDRKPDAPTIANFMARRAYESVNGERTLAEIVLLCRASEFLVCSFLLRLVERGLVSLGETREPDAPVVAGHDAVGQLHELLEQEQYEQAIDLIDANGLNQQPDPSLAMLIAKAEAGFLAEAYRGETAPTAVPRRCMEDGAAQPEGLSTEELLLLEMINGEWDVRSLAWIAPMRAVDVVRGLGRLVEAGYVELVPGESADSPAPDDVAVEA